MKLYDNHYYIQDVQSVAGLMLPWEKLHGKTIMLSGATGLIGSFFIDVIHEKNVHDNLNCKVYALGRNKEKARKRFTYFDNDTHFHFIQHDVKHPLINNCINDVDFILHLASNTHPLLYSTDPIGTITTNLFGLYNLLEFAVSHKTKRFAFVSSNEIYGENRGDNELFEEDYCGYINCNTLRAGYPESKRCGEALCQAYQSQWGIDIVIPRITRSYGPTMDMNDTKAINQFIKKSIIGEDIVLKSAGTQYYSYTYVADAVSGLLTVLLKGKTGEAYNIADIKGDIMLKELAEIIADISGQKVVFETPDLIEAAGYSTATKARLDGKKLRSLGWKAQYDISSGLKRTICILKSIQCF